MEENKKEIDRLELLRLTREQLELEKGRFHVRICLEAIIDQVVLLNLQDSSAAAQIIDFNTLNNNKCVAKINPHFS